MQTYSEETSPLTDREVYGFNEVLLPPYRKRFSRFKVVSSCMQGYKTWEDPCCSRMEAALVFIESLEHHGQLHNENMRAKKKKTEKLKSTSASSAAWAVSMPVICYRLITLSWQCLMASWQAKLNQYSRGCMCSDISSYSLWIRFSRKINSPLMTGISTGSCPYRADTLRQRVTGT